MATSVPMARASFAPLACRRCGGLMVAEACEDVLDITNQAGLSAWRCVQCGEFIDPVVLHNRRIQESGVRAAAS
jgi:primosomal protein N'